MRGDLSMKPGRADSTPTDERNLRGVGRSLRSAARAMLAGALVALGLAAPARAQEAPDSPLTDVVAIHEMARIDGQGESVLRGIGLVTGLRGTGDIGADLLVARPLAQLYAANGNPIPDLRELAKSKSAALVAVEIVIPAEGARRDDAFDVYVTATHTATSLAGGRLFLTALQGPLPGQGVFAMASGAVQIENLETPTSGVVRGGGRVIRDVLMPTVRDAFTLVVQPHFRGWTVTDQLADTINSLAPEADLLSDEPAPAYEPIATALDDATVRVVIPQAERAAPAKFVAKVLSATFNPSLLRLPAQVIVNTRTGSIIVTGHVEVTAMTIAHRDVVVTTATTGAGAGTGAGGTGVAGGEGGEITGLARLSGRAKIQDLLQALKQLDVPVQDQASILMQMHRAGRLHARLVIE